VFCLEWEAAVSSKSRNRGSKATGGNGSESAGVREQKRAQFQEPGNRTGLHLVLAGVALVAVIAVALVVVMNRGGEAAPVAEAPVATGGSDVAIPLADISDGQAHFYSYDAGGTEVKYFVMQSKDGEYRAAFDACDVCYPNKKGYTQQGDVMVCNNCGQQFDASQINELKGGCNPSPIERTVKGQDLVLTTSDLQAGVQYFQ
jgi:uncharacterized membrane protein